MYSNMMLYFCLVTFVSILVVKGQENLDNRELRWCVIGNEEQQKCEGMKQAFKAEHFEPLIRCTRGRDTKDCMEKISKNHADAITLGGMDIEKGDREYGLVPILAEEYDEKENLAHDHYVVAVTHKDKSFTIHNLKGAKACLSGLGLDAGWNLPVAFLLKEGLIESFDCTNPLPSVSRFFSSSCVPGSGNPTYNPARYNVSNLCLLCDYSMSKSGTCSEPTSSAIEGATFRCFVRKADVGFMRHDTVLSMTLPDEEVDIRRNQRRRSNYQLICPDGSRSDVESYRDCNLGKVPSKVVMIRQSVTDVERQATIDLMLRAQKIFDNDVTNWFRLFDSAQLNDAENLIFSDKTIRLTPLPNNLTGRQWIGEFKEAFKDIFTCPLSSIRWCVVSAEELAKCLNLRAQINKYKPYWSFQLECIYGEPIIDNLFDCAQTLSKGRADLATFEPASAYRAIVGSGLLPLAQITHAGGRDEYVVVMGNRNAGVELNDLAEAAGCLPTVDTALYLYFVSYLQRSGQIPGTSCDSVNELYPLLKASCLPGAKEYPRNNTSLNYQTRFCGKCATEKDGTRCSRSHKQRYHTPEGVLRCFTENFMDFAVTTNLVAIENTDMRTFKTWNWNLRSGTFELFCPGGGKDSLLHHQSCNLGQLPNSMILTRPGASLRERIMFFHFLKSLESEFVEDGWETVENKRSIFLSPNGSSLLFPDTGRQFKSLLEATTLEQYFNYNQFFLRLMRDERRPVKPGCTSFGTKTLLCKHLLLCVMLLTFTGAVLL